MRLRSILGIAAVLVFGAVNSFGQATWSASSGNWTTGANWTGTSGYAPTNDGSVSITFAQTGNYSSNIDTPYSVSSVAISGNTIAYTFSLSGSALTVGAGGLTESSGANVTISAPLTGSMTLTQSGTGQLFLTGANTYTGGTVINSGSSVWVGNGVTSGSITGNVSGAGSLAFYRSDVVSFSGIISGSLNVDQNGTGTTQLVGNNTYSGPTVVNSGILQALSYSAFGGSGNSDVTVTSGATLDLNGYSNSIGSLAGGGFVTLGSGSLSINNIYASAKTFSGVISGAGSLVMNGYVEDFTGANTYSLGTTINAGTLEADNATGSATGTGNITITSLGTLQIGNGDANGIVSSGAAITDNGTVKFYRSDAATFPNSITGTGGVGMFGFLSETLTGTNVYSGETESFRGTLTAGSTSAFGGTGLSAVVFDGVGSTIDLATFNNTVGSISGPTGNTITLGTATLTLGNTAANTTFGGVISGTGGSLVSNEQSLILTGSNTYTGSTTINNGLVLVANTSGYGTGTGPITIGPGSTLQIGANSTAGAINPTSTVTDNGTLAFSLTNSVSFPNLVTGTGGVNLLATGQVTLTNANSYSGTTQIEAGTLLADNASGSATGTGNISIYGLATLQIGNGDTNGAVAATSILDNGTLEFARTDNITFGGYISGDGGVIIQEFGSTVTLTGPNVYTGPTQIQGGILADGAANAFSPNSSVQVGPGSTLAVGYNETISDLQNNGGAGNVTLAPGTALTIGTGNAALAPFTGTISGSGSLVISTNLASSLSQGLAGASTFTGGTQVTKGEVFVGSSTVGSPGNITSGPFGTGTVTFAYDSVNSADSELSPTTNVTLANAIVLSGGEGLDNDDGLSNNLTLTGIISETGGSGSIVWCTPGVLTLQNSNTFSGGIDMREGTLLLGSDSAAGLTNGVDTGTITLDDLGPYTTILSAEGTNTVRTIPNPINITGSAVQFGNNDNNNITLSGDITGSTGSVTYAGGAGGHLTITGTNSYSVDGYFTIASGTVNAGSNSAFGTLGTQVSLTGGAGLNVMSGVTVGNTLNFSGAPNVLSGNGTISSAVTAGSSTVVNPSGSNGNGPGTLTFSGGLTLDTGSAIHFDLYDANGIAGTGFGLISDTSAGGLSLTANSNSITFNIVTTDIAGNAASAINFNATTPYSWMFATSTNPISGFTLSPSQFNIDASGFSNGTSGGSFNITESGNSLFLNFTPVPEPSTWALMGLGAAALVGVGIRRRRQARA